MVQNLSFLSFNLSSPQIGLVRGLHCLIFVLVVEGINVSLEELLFVLFWIDYLWAVIYKLVKAHGGNVAMSGTDFVVVVVEVASKTTVTHTLVNLAQRLVSLADLLPQVGNYFVESWSWLVCQSFHRGVKIVGSGQLRHLVLHSGKHVTSCEVDAACELVLVID